MKTANNLEHLADSAALSEPQELLSAIFRSSLVGVAICDSQLRFLAVNKTLAAMNGLAPRAHLGKTIRDVLGHAAAALEPPFKHVFSSGRRILDLEVSAKLPTRSEVGCWIEDYFPIRDRTGTVKQVAAVAVEVTEQRRIEGIIHHLRRSVASGVTIDDGHKLRELIRAAQPQSPPVWRKPTSGVPLDSQSTVELPLDILSNRELEVLSLLAQGKSNKGVASALTISEKTVETYRSRIKLKLGLKSLVELVHYAIRHGIVKA